MVSSPPCIFGAENPVFGANVAWAHDQALQRRFVDALSSIRFAQNLKWLKL
jgi:hypothetical protein